MNKFNIVVFALVFQFVLLPFLTAHSHKDFDKYELVIGFKNEPAYQGEPNGLDLRVTEKKTGKEIKGLEETLKVEIIFGASKKELTVKKQFGKDGAYTANFIPSEEGDYTWHIWGKIEQADIDFSITSSPETFHKVEAKSTVSFPGKEHSSVELGKQINKLILVTHVFFVIAILGVIMSLIAFVRAGSKKKS